MAATSADVSAIAAASAAATEFGLSTRIDGFYDWAGRRLFLLDGSPDPLTPGAYRYQSHPDLCDLSAPESDPSSPRYEPPHLRHQPGDDWEIGGKPYDPDDPGPYGNPLWRPDPRTGRHRRGELPDSLPSDDPSPVPLPPEDACPEPQFASSGAVPPWSPPRRTASAPPEPPEDESSNAPLPVAPDRPSPEPRNGSRFWSEADSTRSESTMNSQRRNRFEADARNSDCDSDSATGPRPVPELESDPYRFGKLREGAWDRWLDKSAGLAADHQRTHAFLQREGGWAVVMIVVFFEWIVAAVRGPAKIRPLQPDLNHRVASQPERHDGSAPQDERGGATARQPALRGGAAPQPVHRGAVASLPVQSDGTASQSDRHSGTDTAPGTGGTDPAPGTARRGNRNDAVANGPLFVPAQRGGGEPVPAPRGRTEAERCTALALRSTRLASAVRGAQRARVQTGGPASGGSVDRSPSRPGHETRAESSSARPIGGTESSSASPVGGNESPAGSFGAKPVSGDGFRHGAKPVSGDGPQAGSFGTKPLRWDGSRANSFGARLLGGRDPRPESFRAKLLSGDDLRPGTFGSPMTGGAAWA